jgi:hypothetical protein
LLTATNHRAIASQCGKKAKATEVIARVPSI